MTIPVTNISIVSDVGRLTWMKRRRREEGETKERQKRERRERLY
jgi:hypothetical protein